jgi:hypothetical protein
MQSYYLVLRYARHLYLINKKWQEESKKLINRTRLMTKTGFFSCISQNLIVTLHEIY